MVTDIYDATPAELDAVVAAMFVNQTGFSVSRTEGGWRLENGDVVVAARRTKRHLDSDNPDEPTLELVRVLEWVDDASDRARARAAELLAKAGDQPHQARLVLMDDPERGERRFGWAVTLHLGDLQAEELAAALEVLGATVN